MVVLEDAGEGDGHKDLADADHVTEEDAAALVEVVNGDLHGLDLELEENDGEKWSGRWGQRTCSRSLRQSEADTVAARRVPDGAVDVARLAGRLGAAVVKSYTTTMFGPKPTDDEVQDVVAFLEAVDHPPNPALTPDERRNPIEFLKSL